MNQQQYDALLAEHDSKIAAAVEKQITTPQIAAKRPDYGISDIVEALFVVAIITAIAFAISPVVGTLVAIYIVWKA